MSANMLKFFRQPKIQEAAWKAAKIAGGVIVRKTAEDGYEALKSYWTNNAAVPGAPPERPSTP